MALFYFFNAQISLDPPPPKKKKKKTTKKKTKKQKQNKKTTKKNNKQPMKLVKNKNNAHCGNVLCLY